MKCNVYFDENVDISQVVPDLSICISDALETGTIHDTGTLGNFNGISEPSQISGRVRDQFEAFEAAQALKKSMSSKAVSASSSTSVSSVKPTSSQASGE